VHTRKITLPRLLSALFLTFSLSIANQPAQAETDYKLGVQAYQGKRFEKAREYWEDSAADGNLSASFNLALLLSKGIGGPVDAERAVSLFRRVADAGLAIGQYNLGLAYYSGQGVAKDNGQAQIWWERAARQNHAQAQFNLGALLWNGEGVQNNAGEAIKWFRKSSDAGNVQAREFLDKILEENNRDTPGAPLETSTSDANPEISALLQQAADAYQRRDYERAFSNWNKAANLGNAVAQYELARLYRQGWGTEMDLSLAFEKNQRSAQQNLPQAQFQLAQDYLKGEQIDKNETLALYWMQSAADQGHVKAKDYLERLR